MGTAVEQRSKHYIQDLIEEGEHEQQDFKFKISDARKIARSISAFANHRGGHLLIGVKDNGRVVGVSGDEEVYMIEQAATMYCRPKQDVHCQAYRVEGKIVVKVDILPAKKLPVRAPDDCNRWRAYYRVADENIVASSVHVKVWKHKGSESATMLKLSEQQRILMALISEKGAVTIDEFMLAAHVSRLAAEEIVVNLCSMRALEIAYRDGECMIKAIK